MENESILRNQQGIRLKEAREFLGLKQNEAAKRLQIGVSGLSDIENGKNNLSAAMSRKIAQYLGINVTWVLTGEGEMMLKGEEQLNVAMRNTIRPFQAMRAHYVETVARITGKSVEQVREELQKTEDEMP